MGNETEFERQLMALDQDKLEALLNKVINYYLENVNILDQDDHWARHDAISDVINDVVIEIEIADDEW
jgi:hypothetical protein